MHVIQLCRYPLGIATIAIFTQACVTTRDGSELDSKSSAYTVQCEPRADLRSDDFKVVGCTFINKGAAEVAIHSSRVSFSPNKLDDQIAQPDAIATYRDQLANSSAPKDAEKLTLVGSMIVATAIVVAGSRSSGGPGSAVFVGGVASPALGTNHADYSAGHLLGPQFSLQPNEHQTKLLLVKTSKETIRPEGMTLCVNVPAAECFDFSFGPSARARVGSW